MTIRDVARAAGVGIKTVSRVLNDEPNVAPATAERVRAAAESLRWRPDHRARTLRRGDARTRTIGLLLGSVANPFSAAIHRAIEDIAAERDVAVFASSLDEDPAREIAAVTTFLRRKVDGLILTRAADSQAYLGEEVGAGIPVIFIDRDPVDYPADVVRSDNRGGAALATRHLISAGHRRIGLLLDRHDIGTAVERRAGFLDALERAGIDPDGCPIVADIETPEDGKQATIALLTAADPPTAVFSAQNLITLGALRALRALRMQHRVALVGFDDIEFGDLVDPGVTVVAQRPSEIGRRAAERVFAVLDGERSAPQSVVVPVDLIPRGSGEIPPPPPTED